MNKLHQPKYIAWLYEKGDNCSDFQKGLRAYMLLGWAKRELLALKIKLPVKEAPEFDTRQLKDHSAFCPLCDVELKKVNGRQGPDGTYQFGKCPSCGYTTDA